MIDEASALMLGIFGPVIGSHARSAIGFYSLPHNIIDEIEMVLELKT